MSTMDVEAINRIAELGVQASIPPVIAVPNEPDGRYYKRTPEGMELVTPQVESRSHNTPELDTLIRYGKACGDNGVIWCDTVAVTLVMYDAKDRRDTLTMKLCPSDHMNTLTGSNFNDLRNQKEMIRFLRIDLAGALPDDSKLIALLRRLKFSNTADGNTDIQHGKESIDRSVKSSMLGQDALPETITLAVRCYENPDLTKMERIKCALDIYPADGVMRLVPLPGAIRKAFDETLNDITNRIEDGVDCSVYRGRP